MKILSSIMGRTSSLTLKRISRTKTVASHFYTPKKKYALAVSCVHLLFALLALLAYVSRMQTANFECQFKTPRWRELDVQSD